MNVLVFGLGLNDGGVGSAKYFAKKGAHVKITDLKSREILADSIDQLKEFPNIEYTLGEHKFSDIDWADLVIKNPAIKPGNEFIEYARKNGKKVETDMGIFLDAVKPSQIIGVTGTKGKSTTASLVYEILKSTNKNIIFAGNIGRSVLDTVDLVTPETLVVLEISSFQLESFEEKGVSPKWAVITNIYPDHLNYYSSMNDYVSWKKVIAEYQTKDDYLFLRKNDIVTTIPEFLSGIVSQINYFSTEDLPKDLSPKLKGEHNLLNIAAAIAVTKVLGVDEPEALEVASNFKGVDFRMQLVKEWQGIRVINDTTATGPDAAIEALKTWPKAIVIAGGMNKGMSYEKYAKILSENAKSVFFLEGDSTDAILSSLQEQKSNLVINGPYDNLEELLQDVKKVAKDGDTILFSPGATSFNMFQNEFDRGRQFNELVQKLFV